MKINWLVEEKTAVRTYKRYRQKIKNNILEKLDGSSWDIKNGAQLSFSGGKAFYCENNKKEEVHVICGPTGHLESIEKDHILIINFMQHHNDVSNEALHVLSDPVSEYKNMQTTEERIKRIRDLLRNNNKNKSDYDLLSLIYLSKDAMNNILSEIGSSPKSEPEPGEMYSQIILPFEAYSKKWNKVQPVKGFRTNSTIINIMNEQSKLQGIKDCIETQKNKNEINIL